MSDREQSSVLINLLLPYLQKGNKSQVSASYNRNSKGLSPISNRNYIHF